MDALDLSRKRNILIVEGAARGIGPKIQNCHHWRERCAVKMPQVAPRGVDPARSPPLPSVKATTYGPVVSGGPRGSGFLYDLFQISKFSIFFSFFHPFSTSPENRDVQKKSKKIFFNKKNVTT